MTQVMQAVPRLDRIQLDQVQEQVHRTMDPAAAAQPDMQGSVAKVVVAQLAQETALMLTQLPVQAAEVAADKVSRHLT
jgi:hypothetical protein